MELEEYIEKSNMRKGVFAGKLGIPPSVLLRYRKHRLRPSYLHATKIVKMTHGIVAWEDLGWTEDGNKIISWTKKELKNNLNSDGMSHNNTLSPHALDSPEKEGTGLLQSQGQRETEGHCLG